MRSHFHAEQWLPYPVEQVFAFFSDPSNLPRLMPEWQKARIDEAYLVAPAVERRAATLQQQAAGDGSRIVLSFRPMPFVPLRLRWDARIADFEWNHQFCDTQYKGPFAYWHHCHRVSPAVDPNALIPGTLLRDDVEYELPFGSLGRMARPLVARQIAGMFRFRQRRTSELLARMAAR